MSKTLSALEQIKEIRRNKLTEALEKSRAAAETPKELPHHGEIHHEEAHHRTGGHPSVGVPVLMIAVIVLGVVFVVINYRVLAELHSVRDSVALVMRKTGVQKGKVSTIENQVAQIGAETKRLRSDLERKEKISLTLIEKVQSDVADTEIAGGILRSKLSELNTSQKKMFDQLIELSNEVKDFKKVHAVPAQ